MTPLLLIYLIFVLLNHNHALNLIENEIDHPQARSHPNPKLPASELPFEIDILKLIEISHKDQGVSIVDGPIKKFPAYKFRLPYNGNVVPLINASIVTDSINNKNGFTLVFLYRQQKNNIGTLLSINSPGRLTPWLQLSSNSRTNQLILKYRLRNSTKLNEKIWDMPKHHRKSQLAAWIWISVSIDFQEDLIRLDIDCEPSRFEVIHTKKGSNRKIRIPNDGLVYFRQEPGRKKKFLGTMQVAKILPYVTHERLWNCIEISSNLAREYQKPLV